MANKDVLRKEFPLYGGINRYQPITYLKAGQLHYGWNVEPKLTGGYRRMLGYAKYDSAEIAGQGPIRGVHFFNGYCYAVRDDAGGATATMWKSQGSGWSSVKTGLVPGGNYEFITATFNTGGTCEQRIFGVSGHNNAFSLCAADTWTWIYTGMATDTPEHVLAHKGHLWLSFGASLQFSSTGDPYTWTPLTGAGEMLMKSPITALAPMTGGVLGIFCRNAVSVLKGSDTSDFTAINMQEHASNVGCITKTLQQLGTRTVFLDDRGVMEMTSSEKFGDFVDATVSLPVDKDIRLQKLSALSSCVVRDKSQYRLFFQNGQGMVFTFAGDEIIGITETDWPINVNLVSSEEDLGGNEVIVFAPDLSAGYIYQMENGNTFDGAALQAYMRTAFHSYGDARRIKRFRRVVFDGQIEAGATIYIKADGVLADSLNSLSEQKEILLRGEGGILGEDQLGDFILNATLLTSYQAEINVHGNYLSLVIYSTTTTENPWEIDMANVSFSPRKNRRG